MDLTLVTAYWGSGARRSYHHTAPINALYGLHEALLLLHEEGIEPAWERHRRNHLSLRAGLEALGLRFIVPEAERLPQLNAVSVPEGVDRTRVRARLLETLSSPSGKRQFRRGFYSRTDGDVTGVVGPRGGPGAHLLAAFTQANCLIVLGEDVTEAAQGSEVDVLLF